VDSRETEIGGKMEVYYRDHAFIFEPDAESILKGHLRLDEKSRSALRHLIDSESDDWYLDADGERLPAEELFLRSPWSTNGPEGTVKLLLRFLNVGDGEILFNTPDRYFGEMYDWTRRKTSK
jgi:hypothetical protein